MSIICKDLVAAAKQLGAKIGMLLNQVQEELEAITIDPDAPTDEECEPLEVTVQDHYLAVVFLLNSDKHRYGPLVHAIKNEYMRGMQLYPTTLSEWCSL
jgi:hypothetical protein